MPVEPINQEGWVIKKNIKSIFLQSKLLLDNNFKHAFFTGKTEVNNPNLELGIRISSRKRTRT